MEEPIVVGCLSTRPLWITNSFCFPSGRAQRRAHRDGPCSEIPSAQRVPWGQKCLSAPGPHHHHRREVPRGCGAAGQAAAGKRRHCVRRGGPLSQVSGSVTGSAWGPRCGRETSQPREGMGAGKTFLGLPGSLLSSLVNVVAVAQGAPSLEV